MNSIQELGLTTDSSVIKSATNVFQILAIIDNMNIQSTVYSPINISGNSDQPVQTTNVFQNQSFIVEEQNKLNFFEQNQITPVKSKEFEEVALEWFEYEKSLTEKTAENPKPLSPKTVEGYHSPLTDIIIPYFKENKNICIITEQDLKKLINSLDGFRTKETVYVVLKMLFDFAREKNYIFYTPRIKKPKKPYTDSEESLIVIDTDRQDIWLDCFETENTDFSLLFETMLLTGLRPEEACGLKWCAIDEINNELVIKYDTLWITPFICNILL